MPAAETETTTLEAALGHVFRDPSLLRQALTHRSYHHEHPADVVPANERLEFLGDAVFHFVAADVLYDAFPEAPEGYLTTWRRRSCAPRASPPSPRAWTSPATSGSTPGESTIDGRGRQSILADALEAVIAAVYKDSGITRARLVVRRLLRPRMALADPATAERQGPNPGGDSARRGRYPVLPGGGAEWSGSRNRVRRRGGRWRPRAGPWPGHREAPGRTARGRARPRPARGRRRGARRGARRLLPGA